MEADEAPACTELVQTATFVKMTVFLFRQTDDQENWADSHPVETNPEGGKSSVPQWSQPDTSRLLNMSAADVAERAELRWRQLYTVSKKSSHNFKHLYLLYMGWSGKLESL